MQLKELAPPFLYGMCWNLKAMAFGYWNMRMLVGGTGAWDSQPSPA